MEKIEQTNKEGKIEEALTTISGGTSWPHIFGIRHLSPGGAWHLKRFLDEIKPEVVLVEGLSDASSQIEFLVDEGTITPVAILAYTVELPIRTLLYPVASYSPEYIALKWAKENNAYSEFIDLPSDVFLALDTGAEAGEDYPQSVDEEKKDGDNNSPEINPGNSQAIGKYSIYDLWAYKAGERDYDTYWEKNFEHNRNKDAYRTAIYEFSKGIRKLSEDREKSSDSRGYAENIIREAFMRRQIIEVLKKGYDPKRIVVITGAYHSSALCAELSPMSDEELKSLPRRESRLTLMPYSYFKLSTQSGYGAGNKAPAYYEMLWEYMREEKLDTLTGAYLSKIVEVLRGKGTYRSTADIIEGVRLANTLAALNSGSMPTLGDLRDAALTCIGHGELSIVAEALARVEVGTAIGNLPEGVSKTPVQDDFYRQLKLLKLEKYKSPVAQVIDLDLRENRRVQSEEAAFIDLNRSFFFHRLKLLGIDFVKEGDYGESSGNWAERWILKWSPEAEIQMVESTLKGETIELAAAFELKERLDNSETIDAVALIIRVACEAGMLTSMEEARKNLQARAVDTGDFIQVSKAARELSLVISYGDIRKFQTEPLIPLLTQLFLRGTLILMDAVSCNNDAAAKLLEAMNYMNGIASEYYKYVDGELWYKKLRSLSDRDDKNPKLSGYACGVLIEKNLIDNEKLSTEVSRRLSPGIEADLGAGWFEGLSMRNRYALLSRRILWEQLEQYVASLGKEEFLRALVFMRRAFGSFSPSEKTRISEILGDIWGADIDETSELINNPLEEEEKAKLNDLNDFDFGDI